MYEKNIDGLRMRIGGPAGRLAKDANEENADPL